MGLAILISTIFLLITGIFSGNLYLQSTETSFLNQDIKMIDKPYLLTFVIFFLVRLVLAAFSPGYPSDMSCWAAWGERVFELGTQNFYAPDYFCDYPPGYIYILGFLARIIHLLGIPVSAQTFIYKLPAVISDMILFHLIISFANKHWGKKSALFLGGLFLLTPIFWFDSAIWGQIESVLLVFLVISILRLYEKRYFPAMIYYVLAVLIKPQGLILAPIYLFALLETRNIKTILSCSLGGIFLFLFCIMPFSSVWQTETGMSAFLQAFNPLWMIEKYQNTLASYPYFSVNAFNFCGLLGLNWVPLDTGNSNLFSVINLGVMALAVLGALFLFLKIKHHGSRLFLSAYFLFGFLYTFAFKMHERYVILPLFFLLLDFIVSKNRKILYLFAGMSSVCFLNLYYVLQLNLTTNVAPAYLLVFPISLLEVSLFVISLWVIYKDYIKSPKTVYDNELAALTPTSKLSKFFKTLKIVNSRSVSEKKEKKMVRLDYYFLSGIILLYSITAFTNLGTTKAPQTFYQPENPGETFVVTLKENIILSEIDYYCGIGELDGNSGLELSVSADGENWSLLPETFCQLNSVFYWEKQEVSPMDTKYIKGVAKNTDYTLYEVGFRDIYGKLAEISAIDGENPENLTAMIDEQGYVTNQSSFQNSTYFDEIYHPRTAYEHLHGLPYYETTHPPLGKLMMAVGVAIFGMSPFGWRCVGTLMGVLMLPIFYLFLKRMFGRSRYAVIGTLLFAFDFMHFSLTRIGTIDSYPVFFILCMYYFMYRFGELAINWARGIPVSRKKQLLFLGLSGVAMGLGCASKWTAVYAGIGLAIAFAAILCRVFNLLLPEEKSRFLSFFLKTCGWCLLFFVLIPAIIYTLSYLPISMVDGYGNVFEAMWNNQEYMLSYHAKLGGTHPYSSKWYTWPFVYKPMWAYQAPEFSIVADQIGCISIFQNPFLSWLGIAAFFYSLYRGIKKRDFRVLFLLIGLLAQYLPWIFVSRYALQYHFFGTLPFLILFIVYAMEDLEKRFQKVKYLSSAMVAICLLMFVAFYPVISGMPVSRFYAETFLTWFDSWVFFI